jgi:hypothetical protein
MTSVFGTVSAVTAVTAIDPHETWQERLDECVALLAIYDSFFRVWDLVEDGRASSERTSEGLEAQSPASRCSSDHHQVVGGFAHDDDKKKCVDLGTSDPRVGGLENLDESDLHALSPRAYLRATMSIPCTLPHGAVSIRIQARDEAEADSGAMSSHIPNAELGPAQRSDTTTTKEITEDDTSIPSPTTTALVTHLPPLVVDVVLPPTYPTRTPPTVHLRPNAWCSSPHLLSALTQEAAACWEPATPSLFLYFEWLKENAVALACRQELPVPSPPPDVEGDDLNDPVVASSSISHLTIVDDDVDPDGASKSVTLRVPSYDAFTSLVASNLAAEEERFMLGVYPCLLCAEDKSGRAFVRLSECGHAWCASCLAAMVSLHVRESQITKLRCPDPTCQTFFSSETIRRVAATPEVYHRWDELALTLLIESSNEFVYCPRCAKAANLEPGRSATGPRMGTCGVCWYVFCARCRLADHPGETCEEAFVRIDRPVDVTGRNAEFIEGVSQVRG